MTCQYLRIQIIAIFLKTSLQRTPPISGQNGCIPKLSAYRGSTVVLNESVFIIVTDVTDTVLQANMVKIGCGVYSPLVHFMFSSLSI